MSISHHSSCCSESSEIIIPVTLKLFIYVQPQEEKKQPIDYSPKPKPISVSSVAIDDRVFIYEVVGLRKKVRRTGRLRAGLERPLVDGPTAHDSGEMEAQDSALHRATVPGGQAAAQRCRERAAHLRHGCGTGGGEYLPADL